MAVYPTKIDPEEALLVKTIFEKSSFQGIHAERVASVIKKMNNIIIKHEEKTGEVTSYEQPVGMQRVQ
tara:strand:- start:879 stop:1082 length:204 start_codon:yes stop_codon:yes gene_type:complete